MGIYYCRLLRVGSIFMRKKIDTQKEQPIEEVEQSGRYARSTDADSFFLFSPPDFSLVGCHC